MPGIATVKYHHDAMIDEIIAFPTISQGELAARFGFTQSWMSIIVNSDSFQERLAERKAELIDPKIRASVEQRLDTLARRSLDKLLEKLDTQQPMTNGDLIACAKLGVGDRNSKGISPMTQNNFVFQIPAQDKSPSKWLERLGRGPISDISHSNPEV
jgi:hypothetical protein